MCEDPQIPQHRMREGGSQEKQRLETAIISSAEARKNELVFEAEVLAYVSYVRTLTGGTSVRENFSAVCRCTGKNSHRRTWR